MGLKLNLGSGQNPKQGYLNVDKYGSPDLKCDLESFPWPWPDNSVSEIILHHVLEHLGRTPECFIGIMKEIYRVCEHKAQARIVVPHPRHDHFLGDPTHVRPVLPEMLRLFSKRANRYWQEIRAANSPLALYHDVDFELTATKFILDAPYAADLEAGRLREEEIELMVRRYNNVVTEIQMTLEVVKGVDQGAQGVAP